jgi:biopolymer transport protein ExbB
MLPTLLTDGGPVIWLILIAAAVALVVFIERVLYCHRSQINSGEFLNGVRNVLKRDNVVEAISICDATPGPVARLVKGANACAKPSRKPVSPRCRSSRNA